MALSRLMLACSLGCAAAGGGVGEETLVERARGFVEPAVSSGHVAGIAIGMIRPRPSPDQDSTAIQPEFLSFGLGPARDSDPGACNAQTIFEIGSISKVFTSLLLAEMVERGEVKLDDPVGKFLPESVTMPTRDGKTISLEQLSTHSSGLPRLPNNLKPESMLNPYAQYDAEKLYDFLTKYKLRHTPGERSVYSNLGVGLLGHALSRAGGKSFEELLRERIFTPLGMSHTSITLSDGQRANLASGHDADGEPQPNWDLNVLAGAGGIVSNVEDLLKFLAAELRFGDTPLAAAMANTQTEHFRNKGAFSAIGLAWQLPDNGKTIWHNGQTGGYHAFIGFRPADRVGVVVLSNTSSEVVDPIGRGLLRMLAGEEVKPLQLDRPATLSEDKLQALAGKYDLGGATLTITRDGQRVWAQLTLQPKARIYPKNETEFYYRLVNAQITFDRDADGKIAGLVLHQNGQNLKAVRKDE